jgi:hypothetical protein
MSGDRNYGLFHRCRIHGQSAVDEHECSYGSCLGVYFTCYQAALLQLEPD